MGWVGKSNLAIGMKRHGIYLSNIPAGGKLNPRFVCFWRSYSRHWMRNAWFWQTIQFMIFAVPLCFGFFRVFCNVFCIHELPKSASFFCSFFEICRFQHISARVFFYRQGQSSRLDSLIQDFGSLLKQAGSSVFPSPLPGPAMLDQSRVISVAFLQGQRLGNSLLQQTPGVIDGARVRTECTTSPSFPKHKLILRVVTTDQERLTSYWTKMLQRNRNVLQVTGRRCYNGSGTSYKLLDEDVTT